MNQIELVRAAIATRRFRFASEEELQAGIAQAFAEDGLAYEREVCLGPPGRIDFLVDGGIGVEVKVDGSPSEVARQLLRYSYCSQITALILVASKASLGREIGTTLGGGRCPFAVERLLGGL